MKLLSKQHVVDCLFSVFPKPKNIRFHKETGSYTSHYNKYYRFAMTEGVYSDASYPYVDKKEFVVGLNILICVTSSKLCRRKQKLRGLKRLTIFAWTKKLIQKQPISGCVTAFRDILER